MNLVRGVCSQRRSRRSLFIVNLLEVSGHISVPLKPFEMVFRQIFFHNPPGTVKPARALEAVDKPYCSEATFYRHMMKQTLKFTICSPDSWPPALSSWQYAQFCVEKPNLQPTITKSFTWTK